MIPYGIRVLNGIDILYGICILTGIATNDAGADKRRETKVLLEVEGITKRTGEVRTPPTTASI
jgi:hypothetical protein